MFGILDLYVVCLNQMEEQGGNMKYKWEALILFKIYTLTKEEY